MASFCKDCSVDYFGKDFEDFKGILTEEQFNMGYAATALCEGCGLIQVDHNGKCLSDDCSKNGHKN